MNEHDLSVMFSATTDETQDTETPDDLFAVLDREFGFDIDVAANGANTKVGSYFGPDHVDPARRDCLTISWNGMVCWLNPPYGEPEYPCKAHCHKKVCETRGYHSAVYRPGVADFLKKAYEESLQKAVVVCLLPVRSDTEWWHRLIVNADERRELEGRLKFKGHEHTAAFPSIIAVFDGRLPAALRGHTRIVSWDWRKERVDVGTSANLDACA